MMAVFHGVEKTEAPSDVILHYAVARGASLVIDFFTHNLQKNAHF